MSADPPQILNGIFSGAQNIIVIDSQFIEVVDFKHLSVLHVNHVC